ncbi:MAG: VOC family protein [Gammaproteobacteria bacterium]|jgi:predicted enzyme related to lactoylglutathione lyase|nr:VOC family protein [Gammaproteobacteria bacterium]MBT6043666.1 VOC family protein [Gammaproteobacteria bacterium]
MAHKINWFDIPVTDMERAVGFYTNVLDLGIAEEFPGVSVFSHEEDEVAGCLFTSEDAKPSTNGILVYFNVDGRLQEAVDMVEDFGGNIEQGAHEIGNFGQRALVIDSEGNRIALHSV